jgi:molecular chaperone GrpE
MSKAQIIYDTLIQIAQHLDTIQQENQRHTEEMDTQVKRLARETYRANTVAEMQAEQNKQSLETLQALLSEKDAQQKQAVQTARLEMARALMPAVDSIEAGLYSGVRQVRTLQQSSPDAALALAGWLKGQRLLLERLLKLLEAEGIRPMQTVGKVFDPYQHVAVKMIQDGSKPSGIIVKEERRGYVHGETVIRYAEVIVNRLY